MPPLTQAYAMTEMSPVMTLLGHEQHRDPRLRQSAGKAAPHVRIRVVDERDVDVPVGTVGQILACGDGQTAGYWNREGYLFDVDRLKDMIISGGANVYSTEVENVLQELRARYLAEQVSIA
jgi:acyl-CoA synthetase (AMP-forming)/AMP-acid ligase II